MNEREEIAAGTTEALKDTGSSAREPAAAENSALNQPIVSQLSTPNSQAPRITDYELLRRIPGGSYGEVWLARSATGVLRALKVVCVLGSRGIPLHYTADDWAEDLHTFNATPAS